MGGGEIALVNLINVLDHWRFRPLVVLAEHGPLVAKLEDSGCDVRVLELDPNLVNARKDTLDSASPSRLHQAMATLKYAFRLARLAKRESAAIIHSNSLKADLIGGVAGRLVGIPVIWHVRDHINSDYLPSRVARLFRWLASWLPSITVAISRSVLQELTQSDRRAEESNESGDDTGDTINRDARNRVSRYQLIYDGCDTRAFQENAETVRQRPIRPVVSLIGRIAEWKGQDVFIESAAEVLRRGLDAEFRIIGAPLFGEHDYDARLRRRVDELGLGTSIKFLGFRSDITCLLAESTLVVHASTLGEPFGQVIIEAMSAGKPVIATDGGAVPEIIEPDVTGLIVPKNDASAMADAIAQILKDSVCAARMGQAGRERVLARFTIQRTARKVEALYGAMLTGK